MRADLGVCLSFPGGVFSEDYFKGRNQGSGVLSPDNVLYSPLGRRYRAAWPPGRAGACCFENACCFVHAASRSGAVCTRLLPVGTRRQTTHIELWPDLLP